jgi:hypothetical protein
MSLRHFISDFFKYTFLAVCFIAMSLNVLSYYPKSKQLTSELSKKEHKNDNEGGKEEAKFCSYEAVVPTVHFNIIYSFCFVVNFGGVIHTPVETIIQSPPLFTTPFYRTLFRMIIAPNAP